MRALSSQKYGHFIFRPKSQIWSILFSTKNYISPKEPVQAWWGESVIPARSLKTELKIWSERHICYTYAYVSACEPCANAMTRSSYTTAQNLFLTFASRLYSWIRRQIRADKNLICQRTRRVMYDNSETTVGNSRQGESKSFRYIFL